MLAAQITAYGGPDVITLREVATPVPRKGEVLVRVHAAPVTAGDARMRSGKVPRGMGLLLRLAIGWRKPRVGAGWSFSGEVAALGEGATGFEIGQKVFGLKGFKGGAHAEYLTIRADGPILPLPEGLSHAEGAAFFFGGLTAQFYLRDKAGLRPGERVLVNGATGSVGSAAVQIASRLGAHVTAIASRGNHALARDLGAAEVWDYRDGPPPAGPYDVIVDVIGTLGWAGARGLLAPSGRLCLVTADLPAMLGAGLRPRRGGRRIITGTSSEAKSAMERLVALYQAGGYRPVVGQTLPFTALAEAHARAETFHKPGNLVVTFAP